MANKHNSKMPEKANKAASNSKKKPVKAKGSSSSSSESYYSESDIDGMDIPTEMTVTPAGVKSEKVPSPTWEVRENVKPEKAMMSSSYSNAPWDDYSVKELVKGMVEQELSWINARMEANNETINTLGSGLDAASSKLAGGMQAIMTKLNELPDKCYHGENEEQDGAGETCERRK